jgi:hypothetical protein
MTYNARLTPRTFAERKRRELRLIASPLQRRVELPDMRPEDVAEHKFRLAAECKASATVVNWRRTETGWSGGECRSGAWHFGYGYQRADLKIEGPDDYGLSPMFPRLSTIYTSAGMAAISAAFVAARQVLGPCRVITRADGYPETRELADLLAQGCEGGAVVRIVDTTVECAPPLPLDDASLVIVDTSCLARSSGRLRRLVLWLAQTGRPVALVRSHMKLDSLGVEYGRLGSLVFLERGPLSEAAEAAVRLTGTAAVPAHFPPFASSTEFRQLTRARIAQMIRNSRLMARIVRPVAGARLLTFPHGLYLALTLAEARSEDDARALARELAGQLSRQGIAARHAGSFGFDFFGCEWYRHGPSGRYGVRVSMADLPAAHTSSAARALTRWLAGRDAIATSDAA